MRHDNRTNILFRYGIIVAVILVMSMRIVGKLIDTTVVHADQWNAKAMAELSREKVIPPERGNILACDGSILAANLRFYTVRLDYRCEQFRQKQFIAAVDTIADSLAVWFPQKSRDAWKAHLLKPMSKPGKERPRWWPVVTNITYAQMLKVKQLPFFNIRNRNKNGLIIEDYMRRVNPYGNMAKRSIGGVGETAESSEIHGISGLERALDSLLYGVPGVAKKVAVTHDFVNWTDTPPRDGYDIVTTIDINMQDIVESELNSRLEAVDADWGLAVLMDVKTGDIKAISNLEKSGRRYIEAINRAVQGYEPGSVVKTISMMIALEDGIVSNPNTVLQTGRQWAYAGGRPITDAHGVNSLTVAEVIERSSNIGMAKIITGRYGNHPGAFYSRLKEIGFFEPFNMGIAGATVPRVDSVPSDRGGRIALSRMAYGYTTEIPPLYTLAIYNAIAGGGRFVRPRLVSRVRNDDTDSILPVSYVRDRICSEDNARKLRAMLKRVVWGNHGTARRLKDDRVAIAGKTGTCYMIENGQYNQSKKRLAFCGFFPADEPKYSCIVLIANPRREAFGAASTSGEVLKQIALKLYSRGLLDNNSDFRADNEPPAGDRPVYHASLNDSERPDHLQRDLAIGGRHSVMRSARSADTPRAQVPDVVGLSPREAIDILESRGFNVTIRGTGNVSSQEPAARSPIRPGRHVTLTLET